MKGCLYLPLLGLTLSVWAQTPVFQSGTDGYVSYRIPAIIKSTNGTLLAFCEGRVRHAGDFGNIDIVMKESRDKGKTWSPLRVIVDADSLQAGNPASQIKRDSLTIRLSGDEGRTWKRNSGVPLPGGAGDHHAYSDLILLHKRRMGILYEGNGYKEIVFESVHIRPE